MELAKPLLPSRYSLRFCIAGNLSTLITLRRAFLRSILKMWPSRLGGSCCKGYISYWGKMKILRLKPRFLREVMFLSSKRRNRPVIRFTCFISG